MGRWVGGYVGRSVSGYVNRWVGRELTTDYHDNVLCIKDENICMIPRQLLLRVKFS